MPFLRKRRPVCPALPKMPQSGGKRMEGMQRMRDTPHGGLLFLRQRDAYGQIMRTLRRAGSGPVPQPQMRRNADPYGRGQMRFLRKTIIKIGEYDYGNAVIYPELSGQQHRSGV